MIRTLTIRGLRGFGMQQQLESLNRRENRAVD
jgi:hypothetical protein